MASKLTEIFEKYKMHPADAAAKSQAWFNQQLFTLNQTKVNANTIMRQSNTELSRVNKLVPGSMYLYEYSALNAATLPYWDKYPLVIPFRQVSGGFYGLNLHYLTPQLRVILLDKLMTFATNKTLDKTTILKFTWQTAAAAAQNKHISACVKMYLSTQVRSVFMYIKPIDWVGAMMLPVESFQGASKSQVWKDSRKFT